VLLSTSSCVYVCVCVCVCVCQDIAIYSGLGDNPSDKAYNAAEGSLNVCVCVDIQTAPLQACMTAPARVFECTLNVSLSL
jgi:hypothetical protein